MTAARPWYRVQTGEVRDSAFRALSVNQRAVLSDLRHLAAESEQEKDEKLTGFACTTDDLAKLWLRDDETLAKARKRVRAVIQTMSRFVILREDRLYVKGWADVQGQPMRIRREQWRRSKGKGRGISEESTLTTPGVSLTDVQPTDVEEEVHKKDLPTGEGTSTPGQGPTPPNNLVFGPATSKFLSMRGDIPTTGFYGHVVARIGEYGRDVVQGGLDGIERTLAGGKTKPEEIGDVVAYFEGVVKNTGQRRAVSDTVGKIVEGMRP